MKSSSVIYISLVVIYANDQNFFFFFFYNLETDLGMNEFLPPNENISALLVWKYPKGYLFG